MNVSFIPKVITHVLPNGFLWRSRCQLNNYCKKVLVYNTLIKIMQSWQKVTLIGHRNLVWSKTCLGFRFEEIFMSGLERDSGLFKT